MAALRQSAWCWTHDPAKAGDRAEARGRGGRNRRTPGRVIGSLGGIMSLATLDDMASVQAGLNLVWLETPGAGELRVPITDACGCALGGGEVP
jgi:hypothetical protein